ncbi:4Fe-4S cluster-binding domain-containing protein [Mycobacterium sp. M26]|uniref:4Fe-4S cluster-binding domain-containing protein n=1 Tax=Mycobacterium sp. M26 TaxID=1762962 RepID=UPI00073F59E8|nr:4Fe-4S cluster-binding domain-containing protein [Mycobacterium sp. M26]
MTSVLLSRLHYPVQNLGYGVRAGIWFQGCSIHCRGCISRDTWPFDEKKRTDISMIVDWLNQLDGRLDGITISGGEPTDQPDALRALLHALAPIRAHVDVLVYSGRPSQELRRDLPWLWDQVDLLISDPFNSDLAGDYSLRGSANQGVHRITPLAEERYAQTTFEESYAAQRQRIAIHVDQRSVWMVGIPKPGDLRRLDQALEERGISIGRTSWLT